MRLTVRTFNDSVKYKEGETPPETKLDEYTFIIWYMMRIKTWLIDNTDRSDMVLYETEAKEVIIVEDESQTGDQVQSEDESQEINLRRKTIPRFFNRKLATTYK